MINLRRIVAVVAFASSRSVRLAAARVRLNAMTASTSQAVLRSFASQECQMAEAVDPHVVGSTALVLRQW